MNDLVCNGAFNLTIVNLRSTEVYGEFKGATSLMVFTLTGYIYNGNEFNWAYSIMAFSSTSLIFNGNEFNGTVSIKIVDTSIF